jgi:hypothetical protein
VQFGWQRARALGARAATGVLELVDRPAVHARLRLTAMCVAGLVLLHLVRGDVLASGYEPLERALARHGLSADRAEEGAVRLQRRGAGAQRVLLRARASGELGDVWVGEAVIGRSGRVSELGGLYNLTQTSGADETTPLLLDHWALFARRIRDEVVGFELLDLRGETPLRRGPLASFQRGVTNLQMTGAWSGVGRRSYTLAIPAKRFTMRSEGRVYVLEVDGVRALLDPLQERPVEGRALFEVRSHRPAISAPLPWLVDTVRGLPFVGAERIAWLENRAFLLRDRAMQIYHSFSETDQAAVAAQELGIDKRELEATREKVERLAVPNVTSGWPPAELDPLSAGEPVSGEGKWRAIVDDPHVRTLPGGAPVFFQTFLHADPERDWARVYLTVWDPRLVQLHIVAGTEEPVSATGETGTGTIPRTRETLTRLVGAFNGGFQAMHGEFGMMADGRVYLPPKPWAATVAVFEDGRVGMGSWKGPKERNALYDEARAVAEIPSDMVAFRQNLTSLVEGDRFNPWGRWWWGAAPQQRSEQTLTQRSALCFTREGFMIYAWGDSASPEALGAALLRARCDRAMHLDMNAGHSGMEFYNVLAPEEPRTTIDKREPYRHESSLPAPQGFTLRARKAVTAMGMMLPRYIRPDPRDFFYLTLKRGIETARPLPSGLSYDPSDLPHAGFPGAFARHVAPTVRLLRIDPSRALPVDPAGAPPVASANGQAAANTPGGSNVAAGAPAQDAQNLTILAELRGKLAPAKADDSALFAVKESIGRRFAIGAPPEHAIALLQGPLLSATPDALAAIGVDGEGLLVYGECDDKSSAELRSLLSSAGVEQAIALPRGVRLGLTFREGVLSVDGSMRIKEPQVALRFVANAAPAVELLYPDNAPMPYGRWATLQDQRVRYFRTAAPTSRAPESANALPERASTP